MAIRRGQAYLTVTVPSRVKKLVTRTARERRVSRSRLVSDLLEAALESDGREMSEGPSREQSVPIPH
jgi:hypothetical protein